jgi:Cu/Ag efflux pump CusA
VRSRSKRDQNAIKIFGPDLRELRAIGQEVNQIMGQIMGQIMEQIMGQIPGIVDL